MVGGWPDLTRKEAVTDDDGVEQHLAAAFLPRISQPFVMHLLVLWCGNVARGGFA
jgi:hypothetical protein